MTNIDYAQLITAETKAAYAAEARAQALKLEVRERIFAVVNQNTQASLLAAAVSKSLSKEDMKIFAAVQKWIEKTKMAGRVAAQEGSDPIWPAVPAGAQELAARY